MARIADELREQGVKASRNRIARLMRKIGIRSIVYKKKVSGADDRLES
ncbi:IS3 family transposase [Spirosoma sp. SC4-14]